MGIPEVVVGFHYLHWALGDLYTLQNRYPNASNVSKNSVDSNLEALASLSVLMYAARPCLLCRWYVMRSYPQIDKRHNSFLSTWVSCNSMTSASYLCAIVEMVVRLAAESPLTFKCIMLQSHLRIPIIPRPCHIC